MADLSIVGLVSPPLADAVIRFCTGEKFSRVLFLVTAASTPPFLMSVRRIRWPQRSRAGIRIAHTAELKSNFVVRAEWGLLRRSFRGIRGVDACRCCSAAKQADDGMACM